MDILVTIFYTFLALGVLVTFHEFGHFWVARRCGVRVEQFSIGFGPALFKWRDKHSTEFILAALPLGGYVRMLDERSGDVLPEDLPYSFPSKSLWQRMAIVAAGPLANFLLASIIFWFMFLGGERGLAPVLGDVKIASMAEQAGFERDMEIVAVGGRSVNSWTELSRRLFDYIGHSGSIPFTVVYPDSDIRYDLGISVEDWLTDVEEPSVLRDLGLTPPLVLNELSLADVKQDGAGFDAGLRSGDRLISFNGMPIVAVEEFVQNVSDSAGQDVVLTVERDKVGSEDQRLDIYARPRLVNRSGEQIGQLGIQLSSRVEYPDDLVRTINYNVFTAVPRGIEETISTSFFVLKSFGKLFTGDLSLKNLSGPISIAKVAGESARLGFDNFIRLIAILSIMLGVMNLLPIPVLDGGHLLFMMFELVKGSPVSERTQLLGNIAGVAMLVGLMVFATFNDLMRTF
jgi:regulator of sigma E protease